MKTLETKRLVLRSWKPNDLELMVKINQDTKVMEHFPSLQNRESTIKLIEHIETHFKEHGYGLYALEVKESQEFIGFTGLNIPYFEIPNFTPLDLPVVEIGWRLAYQQWGKGYAAEAARCVLEHAFVNIKLKEIVSFTAVSNTRSIQLMKKIGLYHDVKDDFEHPKLPKDSPIRQHVLYRLTREDYLR